VAPRLKVFVTTDGLTDYVVATNSRAKALAAWGVRQDLFREGRARETDEAELVKAARAQPGEVLRRPAGTRAGLAKARPAGKAKPAGPSKAALKRVADLERKLDALEAAQAKARARLAAQRADLDHQQTALEAAQAVERKRLDAALSAARRALG
jgi:hypothetical protein